MKKLYIVMAASLAIILAACSPQPEKAAETADEEQKVQIINDTPEEFEGNMEGEYLLLDVRTQEEYDEGHIEGSVLIPLGELGDRLDEISDYKDKPVLVYCRSGNRSVTASNILLNNGFTNVHNLLGGIGA